MIFEGLRDSDLLLPELPTRRARRRAARAAAGRAMALGLVTGAVFFGVWTLLDLALDGRFLSPGEADTILVFSAGIAAGAWLNRKEI